MELNSSTLKGRANVAKLTLAGLGAIGLYMKFGPGKKVKAEVTFSNLFPNVLFSLFEASFLAPDLNPGGEFTKLKQSFKQRFKMCVKKSRMK
jgi:hypothetical protein